MIYPQAIRVGNVGIFGPYRPCLRQHFRVIERHKPPLQIVQLVNALAVQR